MTESDIPAAPIGLVVGLGNPGERYRRTRHNLGRRVVEELADRWEAGRPVDRYGGRLWRARGPRDRLALLAPETYMNLSGDSVSPAAGALKLDPAQVLVVHDEIDLPFAEVRGKIGGGAAGHNGLKSVRDRLGSSDFPRIRLGIGRPGEDFRGDTAAWVLAAFDEPDEDVRAIVSRGADMAERAVAEGMDAAIAAFHAREPGSRHIDSEDASPPPAP